MKCKLSEKCEFGNLCKDATRHDSLTVLGCSSFKAKEPMTNEEWLRSCTTEQLAEWINNIVDDGIIKAWMIKNNCCGDYLESVKWWLKQPHSPK